MNNQYKSEMYSLGNELFNKKFNIPIYQRLYVWGEEQVNTLLEDLLRAYHHNKEHIYYLGGIVVVENHGKFDLIDGQQRFTTLKILREILGDINLSLEFSVRDNVWDDYNSSAKTDNIDIQRMKNARELLKNGLEKVFKNKDNKKPIDKKDFLEYIRNKVNLVVTKVPKNTDLNKLFELINGRGEQLQQHEILKAKILYHIKDEKKEYGKIWDICADMDNYIDISIKKTILKENGNHISWGDYFDSYKELNFNSLLENMKFKNIDENKKSKNVDENSILFIINSNLVDVEEEIESNDLEDEASTEYLPIISFPLFLLYILVLFKKDEYFTAIDKERIEFKDKNLIKIFETVLLKELTENKAKEFIESLFKSRILFDKWIIRNRKEVGDVSNDTNHQISKIEKINISKIEKINISKIEKINNGKVISRQIKLLDESRDLALLQSMLYHSHTRNTQEWIIPFLEFAQQETNTIKLLKNLMNIDDYIYSDFDQDGTILEKSVSYINKSNYKLENYKKIVEHLRNIPKNYHYFSHYWFYKMDWMIWSLSETKDDKFKFTARNSIEHIGAQNPNDENIDMDKVSENCKHSFGNLFLVSVSQNSSLGNSGFNAKKSMFKDKNIKNLKFDLISEYTNWGDIGVNKHLDVCINKIEEYYNIKS